MQFIETLLEKSNIEKARFLKELVPKLAQFSHKTGTSKILPILLEELKNTSIVSFLLPSIFWYCQLSTGYVRKCRKMNFKRVYILC
jgi:hypothetical protein